MADQHDCSHNLEDDKVQTFKSSWVGSKRRGRTFSEKARAQCMRSYKYSLEDSQISILFATYRPRSSQHV